MPVECFGRNSSLKIVYRWNVEMERLQSNRKRETTTRTFQRKMLNKKKFKENQHPGNVKSGHHLVPVLYFSYVSREMIIKFKI